GIGRFGKTPVLQQQLALALAQTGAVDAARELLNEMVVHAVRDEETLCLLGRVHKELWRRANDPAEAAEAVQQACKFYGDAFDRFDTYYPGINYAFALAASGDLKMAEEVAGKVARLCREKLAKTDRSDRAWLLATLGEALVHQGATTEAAENYRLAAEICRGRWRDLA